jgi:hypothetical protein
MRVSGARRELYCRTLRRSQILEYDVSVHESGGMIHARKAKKECEHEYGEYAFQHSIDSHFEPPIR